MSLVDDIKTMQRAVGAEADGRVGPETVNAVLRHLAKVDLVDPETVGETPTLLDARTAKNIASLDPKARERFEQFAMQAKATAATFGCDYVMISGNRTYAEQDALFAKVPKVTNARGGYSNHNFGIAGDFAVFRGKSYLDDADPKLAEQVHRAVAVHARKLGFEWGGDWKSFKDFPHFELSTGLTLAQKRAAMAQKGSVL